MDIEITTETTVAFRMPEAVAQALKHLVRDALVHGGWSATNEAQIGSWRDQFPSMSSDDWAVLQTVAGSLESALGGRH